MATSDDLSKKNLDQLEPSFMYTQILKEILLSIKFEQKHTNEYIQYCRDVLIDNEGELKNVKEFERDIVIKHPSGGTLIRASSIHAQSCSTTDGCRDDCQHGLLY